LDQGGNDSPNRLGLKFVARGRTGIEVVGEEDTVAHEHLVFQGHALTNESMAANLAETADFDPFLDLHESPDLGIVPHFTAVKIDQVRLRNEDVLTEFDRRGDGHSACFLGYGIGPLTLKEYHKKTGV